MLASNPLRNSRSETITGATRGVAPPPAPHGDRFPDARQNAKLPNLRKPSGFTHTPTPEERDRFPMPQKTQARTCANPPRELDPLPH